MRVCVCVRACVCVCGVRARACVRACVRVCVRERVRARGEYSCTGVGGTVKGGGTAWLRGLCTSRFTAVPVGLYGMCGRVSEQQMDRS